MTTNGVRVCLDRWYVIVIFSCLMQTVPMHFDGLFDCSIGHFNRQSRKAAVRSGVVLYCTEGRGEGVSS